MIYLDTSSLLKVLLPEPESPAVHTAIAAESEVIISPLAELEIVVQFRGMWTGGSLSNSENRRLHSLLQEMRSIAPFEFPEISQELVATALRQHKASEKTHCRAFDRLHLAAMEGLAIRRLMTHDETQASAAKALGFEIVTPR